MNILIEELKNKIKHLSKECDYETRLGNLNKTSALIGKIDAYEDVINFFDKYNAIILPNTFKLSDMIRKIEKTIDESVYIEENDDGELILYCEFYDVDYIESNHINLVIIDKNMFIKEVFLTGEKYKWLFELWLTKTDIENDVEFL